MIINCPCPIFFYDHYEDYYLLFMQCHDMRGKEKQRMKKTKDYFISRFPQFLKQRNVVLIWLGRTSNKHKSNLYIQFQYLYGSKSNITICVMRLKILERTITIVPANKGMVLLT